MEEQPLNLFTPLPPPVCHPGILDSDWPKWEYKYDAKAQIVKKRIPSGSFKLSLIWTEAISLSFFIEIPKGGHGKHKVIFEITRSTISGNLAIKVKIPTALGLNAERNWLSIRVEIPTWKYDEVENFDCKQEQHDWKVIAQPEGAAQETDLMVTTIRTKLA